MKFLSIVREANRARLPLFTNSKGERYHDGADGDEWTLDQWLNATLGELGEAANEIKKLERGDHTDTTALAYELADTYIYFDIYGLRLGFEPPAGVYVPGPHMTPTEHTRRLLVTLGALARYDLGQPGALSLYLRFIGELYALADDMEVDLEDAITRKFNAVSEARGIGVSIAFGQVHTGES